MISIPANDEIPLLLTVSHTDQKGRFAGIGALSNWCTLERERMRFEGKGGDGGHHQVPVRRFLANVADRGETVLTHADQLST